MKKLLLLLVGIICGLTLCLSQDRVNEKPTTLSYKSKEIRTAMYWYKDPKNGKWKSRFNAGILVSGRQGEQIDNFRSLFIGQLDTLRFIFIDYDKGEYKYPNLEQDWTYYRTIFAALITDTVYDSLKNIEQDEIVNVVSAFTNDMYKDSYDYSFSFFLQLVNTNYSADMALYKYHKKEYGEEYAKSKFRENNPPKYVFAAKRTKSNGQDVVRFQVFPIETILGQTLSDLDDDYFEVPYKEYLSLFTSDSKLKYK